jgi:trimethylamine-N-oxide reductase (cytochrome c)
MNKNALNVKLGASKRVFKPGSLMGSKSGPPTVVESDDKGKITRIRPYFYEEDNTWESLNPWKLEARGRTFAPPRRTLPATYYISYKKRVYSENRVRYPLKRVDWDPKGERNTQNRGKSRYIRISWDEAAQTIADELLRVKEKYGMSAVLAEADMHGEGKHIAPAHGCMNRLLSLLGGYTVQMRNMDSWEGFAWGSKNVWGDDYFGVGEMLPSQSLWPDIAQHAELLLFWAGDPEVTAAGFDGYMASRLSQWLHSLGLKFVYIDPALNYSGCYQADKWIPVLPNTDSALYLGIAHTWLTEGTYDRDYVEKHAVGYEGFFEYVLGETDGEPKTAKWASEKCGVPPWTIKALARDWASKITTVTIGNGGPGIRGPFSTEPARLQSILLSMQGLGKPGQHQAKWLEWNLFSNDYAMPYQGKSTIDVAYRTEIVRPTGSPVDMHGAHLPNDIETCRRSIVEKLAELTDKDGVEKARLERLLIGLEEFTDFKRCEDIPPSQSIPKCLVHDAILDGKVEWWGLNSFCGPSAEQWIKHEFPMPGCSNIHAIWTDSPCMVTCWNDGFRFVKAIRDPSIEFIVAQQPWLENDCILADIILPVQTKFEMNDIADDAAGGVVTSIYREYPACPPVGESLHDFDCVAEVAKKLGDSYYKAYTREVYDEQIVIDLFFNACGVAHMDENDDFHKKDIYVVPCDPERLDLEKYPAGLSGFNKDPENNPLHTPTGKLEFTSTGIAENFPDDEERPPYPKYIEKSEKHDETLFGERAKTYPLLCMSNHGRWRFHANLDDITWHREVETMKIRAIDGYQYESMWINPITAAERGISHGDIVKVFNERGTVLCGAYVTERLTPGVVYVDHGSRFDPIDAERLDRGGAINLITPTAITSKTVTGMVISGFLVETAKVTDEEMATWRDKFPEAFGRKVDESCGVCLDGWMIKDAEVSANV